MKRDEIQIRDPFILPDEAQGLYYLFGTTDRNCWIGPGSGFNCYKSRDLRDWTGPISAFRAPEGFWGTSNFWAPEVHRFNGRFYMLASFKADECYRATQVLVSDAVEGPYAPLTNEPITPPDWECLDGTLHVDQKENPWIVFCQECVQVHNGGIYALPLSADLKRPVGRPVLLFHASEAPWVLKPRWPDKGTQPAFPTYITDGPFLHRLSSGVLIMLWSSSGQTGYAMGIARSETGDVTGPWHQVAEPLWGKDGGHGMIFKAFDGRLFLTLHTPNNTPNERPVFVEIEETADSIRLKE